MHRRKFLGLLSALGGSLAGCNYNASGPKSDITRMPDKQSNHISESPQTAGSLDSIEKQIEKMPAFNNHFHPGLQPTIASFDWYFTQDTIFPSNAVTRIVMEALQELLGCRLEGKNTRDVRRIYEKYCRQHTQRDFYTSLADLTNTSHIVFMSEHWNAENKNLASGRMLLVPYASHWIFPLDNTALKKRHSFSNVMIQQREARLQQDQRRFNCQPSSFQFYLDFIDRALDEYRRTPHVVGLKWGFAYWRTLDIQLVTKAQAQTVYESQDSRPEPYKKLQDYLIFHILKKCAQLQLPLQIHTGLGAQGCLVLPQSNPALLDLLFSQSEFDNARVACLHGGYPYCKELGVVVRRKNVWLDFSWMVLLLQPEELAPYLKEWIQIAGAHKLLFGIDGTGLAQVVGTSCARKALSIALSQLTRQGFYSLEQALNAAQAILQKNALRFYNLS